MPSAAERKQADRDQQATPELFSGYQTEVKDASPASSWQIGALLLQIASSPIDVCFPRGNAGFMRVLGDPHAPLHLQRKEHFLQMSVRSRGSEQGSLTSAICVLRGVIIKVLAIKWQSK